MVVLLTAGSVAAGTPPDFKLKDLDGNWFQLRDHLGKEVIYISFWATWCVPCRRELAELQKMYDELSGKGFLVVAVNTDPVASESQVKPWVKQRNLKMPCVRDPDNNAHDKYNPTRSLPFGVLIDRTGAIAKTYAGYRTGDEAILKEEVLKLLGDAPSAPKEPAK